MKDIYAFLDHHGISYERHDHPPLFTCEDAHKWIPHLNGAPTKNLFLRDKKGKRHFLVVVPDSKTVALKSLSALIGVSGLSFGSAERLKKYLGIEPGAVSMLALIHDAAQVVEVIIDQDLWHADTFQCHPLVNTSTLLIPREDIKTFLKLAGHDVLSINIP